MNKNDCKHNWVYGYQEQAQWSRICTMCYCVEFINNTDPEVIEKWKRTKLTVAPDETDSLRQELEQANERIEQFGKALKLADDTNKAQQDLINYLTDDLKSKQAYIDNIVMMATHNHMKSSNGGKK